MSARSHALIHRVGDIVSIVDLCVNAHMYDIQRGDIVVCEEAPCYGYRAHGMYFFDGKRLIGANINYDDYGTVPAEFDIMLEFRPGYWDLSHKLDVTRPICRDYAYVNGCLRLVPGAVGASPLPYWHDIQNRGIVQLNIEVAIKSSLEISLFTYNVAKFVIIKRASEITFAVIIDSDILLDTATTIWAATYYNSVEDIEIDSELISYICDLGVDVKNIMIEI